jgi:hypothetical protein
MRPQLGTLLMRGEHASDHRPIVTVDGDQRSCTRTLVGGLDSATLVWAVLKVVEMLR